MAPPPNPAVITILDHSRVSPPPNSVPNTTLPLTFFDLLWYSCCPMKRLYFYQFPHSLQRFSDSVVPSLKRSLSLALRQFFPFAGQFVSPSPPQKPFLRYSDGDSILFTVAVAESASGEFGALFADRPRQVLELHPFAPAHLPAQHLTDGGARSVPVMALQVTFFPGSGFVLGVTFCHVTADGKSFHLFMKSWASLCNQATDPSGLVKSTPFHGRDIMKSLDKLQTMEAMEDFWEWASKTEEVYIGQDEQLEGKVRSTFLLSKSQIDKLKSRVKSQDGSESPWISAFVVTCALAWTCSVQSDFATSSEGPCFFVFVADCRDRLDFPVPSDYFGNCLAFVIVSVEKRDLIGPNGIFAAARAIGERVRSFEVGRGVMEGADTWLRDWSEIHQKYHNVTVAGSPRLGVYETDFGWGRPAKTEVVHTDVSGAISLCDRCDGRPGIELSLALTEPKMNRFRAIFEETFNLLG